MAEEIVEQGYRELAETILEHNPGVDLGRVRAAFEVADISKTSVCPLCRVMRYELRQRGIRHLNVVWSDETPLEPLFCGEDNTRRRGLPGSTSFVPAAAGMLMASRIILDLTGETR